MEEDFPDWMNNLRSIRVEPRSYKVYNERIVMAQD